MRLNPPDSFLLQDGDEVIVLAEDDDAYSLLPQPEVPGQGQMPSFVEVARASERILFLNWRRDMDDMIMELDTQVGKVRILVFFCLRLPTTRPCRSAGCRYMYVSLPPPPLSPFPSPPQAAASLSLLFPTRSQGSVLYMLNGKSKEEQEWALRQGGLEVERLQNLRLVYRQGEAYCVTVAEEKEREKFSDITSPHPTL